MPGTQAPWYRRRATLLVSGGLVLGVGAILAGVYGSRAANAGKPGPAKASSSSTVQTQSTQQDPYSSLVRANPLPAPTSNPPSVRPVPVDGSSASLAAPSDGDKAVAPGGGSGGEKSWFQNVMGNLGFGDAGDKAVASAADAWKVCGRGPCHLLSRCFEAGCIGGDRLTAG
jgi:hypothetical protein